MFAIYGFPVWRMKSRNPTGSFSCAVLFNDLK